MKRRFPLKAATVRGSVRQGRNARHTRIFSLLMCMAALFTSCVYEDEIQPPETGGVTDKEVNFIIAAPYAAPAGGQTRAIEGAQENAISNIYVLAFKVEYESDGTTIKSETYDYSAIGKKTTDNTEGASSQSFTAKVKVKDYKQRFVVITNAEAAVTALTSDPATWQGANKAAMLARLEVALGGGEDRWNAISASNYTAFPMWGESGAEKITGSTNTLSMAVPMLRMVAKINVQLDETVSGLTGKFKMKSVYLYNTNTSGRVVPSAVTEETRDSKRYLYVQTPTVPSGATLFQGPIEYLDFTAPGTENVAMKGAIYTFETEAPSDGDRMKATCLVVGGLYDTDSEETYYRLDFFESDGTTLRDMLRNHQYVVNIIDVKGRGYESEDMAYKSKSVNMVAEIQYWNESGLGNSVFDGQNILSVSQDKYFFTRDEVAGEQENNVLEVLTDYVTSDGGKSGWYVEKIVDAADGTTPVTWPVLTPDRGAENVRAKVILTAGENDTPQERSAIVWIAAGRLRYPVTVKQSLTPILGLYLKEGENTVTELVFASSKGVPVGPTSRTLTVNWQPKNADLIVSNAGIGTNPFPSGVGEPQSNVPGGNNGTGTIDYAIEPLAFTDEELDEQTGDPFLEKVSKVDFVTTNGVSYASANLFLRQINYNLLSDAKAGYMLGSQTETIHVRANFGWTILEVTDNDNILQNEDALKGLTGGNNTTTGNAVSFTMVAEDPLNPKMDKTATITFKSQRDGSTWDVVITALEALFVGYFGGKLNDDDGDGVWQFERALYVQNKDESTGVKWYSNTTATSGVTDDINGRANTYTLRNLSTNYEAATLCYNKNDNYNNITSASELTWYLPAQKQLMAAWVSQAGFDMDYQFNASGRYWSATEFTAAVSWFVDFSNGTTLNNGSKTLAGRVRCVREL